MRTYFPGMIMMGCIAGLLVVGCVPPEEKREIEVMDQRSGSGGAVVRLSTQDVSIWGADAKRVLVLERTMGGETKKFQTKSGITDMNALSLHTDDAKGRAWVVKKSTGKVIFSADFEAGLSWGVGDDQPDWAPGE